MREKALPLCRILIQKSASSIRFVHRKKIDAAYSSLQDAELTKNKLYDLLTPYPELFYAGYYHDAEKEYVEANFVLAIIENKSYPTIQQLSVAYSSYLNGAAEASSECRRYLLQEMGKGNSKEAERILSHMELIYEGLITFDFPDILTGNLKRTFDNLRAVLERTQNDWVTTNLQYKLISKLDKIQENLR